MRVPTYLLRRALPLALAVVCLSPAPAGAQAGSGPVWIALDTQPPGTTARVVLNRDLSTASDTWFDVFISGFYVTTRMGDDGRTYQDLSVPGLPSTSTPGEPRMPHVRADLGIVTSATASALAEAQLLDLRSLSGYLVWPSPIPARIHDGTPSMFARDSVTYTAAVDYPWVAGYGGTTRTSLGGIPAGIVTAYPVRWNPTTGLLTVAAHARYHFTHPGGLSSPMGITVEHSNLASDALLNWDTIRSDFTIDFLKYNGAYLFICQAGWVQPDLQKLINEKKSRGFSVTVKNVLPSGQSCSQLQQIIMTWYAGTPAGWDHYCLLVGGPGSTPFCFDANGQLSDKVLSSVDNDLEAEIYLGRLYVDSPAELKNQVDKILAYETGPQVNNDQNVLLVAHQQQDQDFDFPSYQDAVRFALYTQVTPNFITAYGNNGAVGNADITNNIQNGVGVVCYIGHGTTGSWRGWCAPADSFTYARASALTNGADTPVIWSIACQTGDLRQSQSLANGFMKNTAGAVAFYGAVDETFGSVVAVLEDTLFQAVYSRGVTRHGLAIALAEHATVVADSLFGLDAVYKYVLYGDPEMEIKRLSPSSVFAPVDLLTPINVLAPCPGVQCGSAGGGATIDIQVVQASSGAPVAGVKVGLWKPAPSGDADEVLDNRYSAADGWVHIPVPELTAGTLYVGFDGGQNRTGLDSIRVDPPAAGVAGGAGEAPLLFRARPSVTAGATRFEFGRALSTAGRVIVFSVDGRVVRVLRAAAGAAVLDWDGRDSVGRPVAAGIYLGRLETSGARRIARVAVIR